MKTKTSIPLVVLSFGCVIFDAPQSRAAVVLTGSSYTETFDGIGASLPTGWSIHTAADASSLGTAETFTTTQVSWGDASGAFKNVASADGLASGATVTAQNASTDRALGIRQIATFGDPGASFVLTINSTAGFESFTLGFKAQMLSVQTRSTTWTIQYQIGAGSFVTLDTYTDPGTFGSTSKDYDLGSAWDNLSDSVTFRVVALGASSGSGSRDTFAIDDFALNFSAVPEAWHYGLSSALGLLAIAAGRRWKALRRARARSCSLAFGH